jgi:uncharacterized protein (DUF4415 family)
MDDRRRSARDERRHARLVAEVEELEAWWQAYKVKDRAIPAAWHSLHRATPCTKRKTRVTLDLDADVARWWRGLGPGYQARVNQVLRVYMLAVASKEIEMPGDRDWAGRPV